MEFILLYALNPKNQLVRFVINMTLEKLFMLSRLSFRSNKTNNIIYVFIFSICITMSLIVIHCSLVANYSIDAYLNNTEDGIRYRQFVLKTDVASDDIAETLKTFDNIESIQYNTDSPKEIFITTQDYALTDLTIHKIENYKLGVIFRKTEDMVELTMIKGIKSAGGISLVLVGLFIIIVLKTNISHSIEERQFEIALYISTGYTKWIVSLLLFVENFFLLLVSSLISYIIFSQVNVLFLSPQIHHLSNKYLNIRLPYLTNTPLLSLISACIFISVVSIMLAKNKIKRISPSELLKS